MEKMHMKDAFPKKGFRIIVTVLLVILLLASIVVLLISLSGEGTDMAFARGKLMYSTVVDKIRTDSKRGAAGISFFIKIKPENSKKNAYIQVSENSFESISSFRKGSKILVAFYKGRYFTYEKNPRYRVTIDDAVVAIFFFAIAIYLWLRTTVNFK